MPVTRTRHAPVWAALTTATAGLLLAAWAAVDSRTLVTIEPTRGPTLSRTNPPPPPPPATASHPPSALGPILPSWAWASALAVVLVVGLVLLGRAVLRRLRRLAGPDGPAEPTTVVHDLAALAHRREAHREAALESGSPRNGVVACWLELEELVATAGHARRPHETSSELVIRVLDDHTVPREALTDLAVLYREARFSTHELTETDRARARECLRRTHEALRGHRVEHVDGAVS